MDRELKRKLAAILVADVVGYSRLIADDEEATLRRLEVFRSIWQDAVTRCNGRIFNTAGDSILAEFQSAVEAVRCAVDFQAEAKKQNDTLVAHRQMHFRVGITIGDVVERGSDLLGDGVNVAARLQTLSGPGGICVSSWVREAVANKLGVKFTDLGDQTVKNIPTPIRAYKVGDASPPLVIGGTPVTRSAAMSSAAMQDWLGKIVSSWQWLAAFAGIATIAVGGSFLIIGQMRSSTPATSASPPSIIVPTPASTMPAPKTATPPATTSVKSPVGDILRDIDRPKQSTTPAAAPTIPALPKVAVDTPKSAATAPVTPTPQPKQPAAQPKSADPAPAATSPDPAVRRGALSEDAERNLKSGDRFKECDNCPEMVVVPHGDFIMGSSSNQPGHEPDEMPARKVWVAARIAVARYPVTVDEYDTFVTVTGYRRGAGCRVFEGGSWVEREQLSFRDPGFPQTGNHPVVCVNWNDAKAYTDWMSARLRVEYRLPTEAEREYAARAGTVTTYSWGNDISPARAAYDWSSSFAGSKTAEALRGTQPVAAFAANPWGLVQMHGNVSEWVEDCWNDSYRAAPVDGTAWTAGDCRRRVLRGGSWGYSPKDLRSAYREGATLSYRNFNFGFRVVRVLRDGK